MKKNLLAMSLVIALIPVTANSSTTINGFASIKAGITTGSDEQLYGYDDTLDFKNESLIALQVKSDLGEKLSVTAQLLGRGQDDFDVGFEWAFISYQLSDNMTINAGRLRTPFYKYSDFKDVGYAYDWLRVPQGVYGLGFDSIEGLTFYRTAQLGNIDSTLQLIFGGYDGTASLSGTQVNATIDNVAGITWELAKDAFSARFAYLIGKTSIETTSVSLAPDFTVGNLYQALAANGLSPLVTAIDIDDESSNFTGIGLTYDDSDWIAVAEYTRVEVENSFVATQKNWYASLGKRFNSFTPYISYERENNDAVVSIYQPYTAVLPPQLLVPVQGLVASQERDASTWNIGVRYDFHPSAAFKAQFSSEDNDTLGQRNGLLAFGVDLVF
ncbi:porin [Arsukibacterium sp.]|uniref:porin n=1 Tax=Arsukibacterium sp. TaxID=1977258 RepID=UPI0026238C3B|nr:porin [Arsukibacterium sp.]